MLRMFCILFLKYYDNFIFVVFGLEGIILFGVIMGIIKIKKELWVFIYCYLYNNIMFMVFIEGLFFKFMIVFILFIFYWILFFWGVG